jgi:hypothetical protein
MTDSVLKGFDIATLKAAAFAMPVGSQKTKWLGDISTQIGSNPIYKIDVDGTIVYQTTISGTLPYTSAGIALPAQFTEPPTVNLVNALTDSNAVEIIQNAANPSIRIETPIKAGGATGFLTASKALNGTWYVRTSGRLIKAPSTMDVSVDSGGTTGI